MTGSPVHDPSTDRATLALLEGSGFNAPYEFKQLSGGANNRVFEVGCTNSCAILKYYLRGGPGERDRLGSEFDFLLHVAPHLAGTVAAPIARSNTSNIGLFGYLDGRPVAPADLTSQRLQETISFLQNCNRHRDEAHHLPDGAEACFSVSTHIRTIERRLLHLEDTPKTPAIFADLHRYLAEDLRPAWERIRDFIEQASTPAGQDIDTALPRQDRCISPSDFGYHNALILKRGALGFFDFEYAGWDDPAKLIGDFFSQPRIPAPLRWFDEFSDALATTLGDSPNMRTRARVLLPLYRIKWCLIMLNEFLPSKARRRTFSGQMTDLESAMAEQLHRSQAALARLSPGHGEIRITSDDGDVIIKKVSN